MYEWPNSYPQTYLGAAHGLSGILWVLLCVPDYALLPEIRPLIEGSLDYLASLVLPSGNWGGTVKDRSDSDNQLVQWCHGAPGVGLLWCKAYQVFNNEKYLTLAKTAARATWKKGLLVKGKGLCHGVCGNGYLLLEVYRITQQKKYLCKAFKFLEFCWSETAIKGMRTPSHPLSLFEGDAIVPLYCLDIIDPTNFWGIPGQCL